MTVKESTVEQPGTPAGSSQLSTLGRMSTQSSIGDLDDMGVQVGGWSMPIEDLVSSPELNELVLQELDIEAAPAAAASSNSSAQQEAAAVQQEAPAQQEATIQQEATSPAQ